MKFSETDSAAGHLIDAYGPEGVRVDGNVHGGGLILSAASLVEPWGPASVAELTADHLEPVIAMGPEVVLLGTGGDQVFPDPSIHHALGSRGIGLEVMDTGAACRTYNILMAEGRRVVAALLPF